MSTQSSAGKGIDFNLIKSLVKRHGHVIQVNPAHSRFVTGLQELDDWTGGGLPRGRIIELYGVESSGKSTFAMELSARIQKQGGFIVWVDYEWSWDAVYAKQMGVRTDPKHFLLIRPSSLEEGFDIMREVMLQQPGGFYVVDSLAAGQPMGDIDKSGGEKIGGHSAAVSSKVRSIQQPLGQCGGILLIINQIRTMMKKGGPGGMIVGQTTTGGYALRFYAAMRWKIRRAEKTTKQYKGATVTVLVSELQMTKTKVSETEGATLKIWVVPGYGCRIAKARTNLNFEDEPDDFENVDKSEESLESLEPENE